MNDMKGKILDLIAANNKARDHYDGTCRALEDAAREARGKNNPQPTHLAPRNKHLTPSSREGGTYHARPARYH